MSSNSKYKLLRVNNCAGETLFLARAFVEDGPSVVAAADAVENPRAVELVERANRCVEANAEAARLREALEHIAAGNISPSMDFAANVLAGMSALDAHRKAVGGEGEG